MKNHINHFITLLFFSLFLLKNACAIHTITSFSPVSAYPRAVVTITGANLAPTSGAVHVFFGNAKAQVLAVYNDSLKVRVPFGATVAPITISVNGFTVATLNQFVPSYPASTATPTNLNFWPTEGNLNLSYTGQALREYASADLDNDGNKNSAHANLVQGTSSSAISQSKQTNPSKVKSRVSSFLQSVSTSTTKESSSNSTTNKTNSIVDEFLLYKTLATKQVQNIVEQDLNSDASDFW